MASGSALDMLVTTAMSVNDVQNIAAVMNMSEVLPETILEPIQICACAKKTSKVAKNCGTCHKTQTGTMIALKFGTHEKGNRAHLGTKFGLNTSISGWVINYSRNTIPICCHAYMANSLHYEAENRYVDCLNIQP